MDEDLGYEIKTPRSFHSQDPDLTAETCLTIKGFAWNWHIIYPKSHHE